MRAFLKNPDANASSFRVIIYTSAMGSGVDISTTHAAAVFGFFDRQPLTAWDMHQAMMRFRNADQYNVWVDPAEAELTTNEQEINERLLKQERGTIEAVRFDENGNDVIKQSRLQLAVLQAAVTRARTRVSTPSARISWRSRLSVTESPTAATIYPRKNASKSGLK